MEKFKDKRKTMKALLHMVIKRIHIPSKLIFSHAAVKLLCIL